MEFQKPIPPPPKSGRRRLSIKRSRNNSNEPRRCVSCECSIPYGAHFVRLNVVRSSKTKFWRLCAFCGADRAVVEEVAARV